MLIILKIMGFLIIVLGLIKLYEGARKETVRASKRNKFILGGVAIILGLVIFPTWSDNVVDAENWAHTKFRQVYWDSVNTLEDMEDQIGHNTFYLDDSESESRQAYKDLLASLGKEYEERSKKEVEESFKRIDRKLSDGRALLKKSKAPWYLRNSIYRDGNKILDLQEEQIELMLKQSKGFQRKKRKFYDEAWDISVKIDDIDKEIELLLEQHNLLYY